MVKREVAVFLIVGTTTVVVDFVTYLGLMALDVLSVDLAKGVSFLTGTVFAYFANRFWTFDHKSPAPGSWWRFALLYSCTLGANVLVNAVVLGLLTGVAAAVTFAFLVATGVSAVLNFLGMKFFVFREVVD